MELLLLTSQILNLILFMSVGARVALLLHDPSVFKNLVLSVGALAAGIAACQYIAGYAAAHSLEASIICQPKDGGLWFDCNGWPIVFESVAKSINSLSEVFGVGMKLPALTAQILGGIYIHRRLTTSFFLDPREIVKAFFGGIFLYSSLIWLPVMMSALTNAVTDTLNIQGMVTSGRETLSGTLRAIKGYEELAGDDHSIGDMFLAYFLMFEIYAPGFVLSVIGLVCLFAQNLMLAFIPFYAFTSLMSRQPDYMIAVKTALSYIGFVAFQVILWIAIALYPDSYKTGNLENITLGDAASSMLPILFVTVIILLLAKFPSQWLTATMKTLTLVRIK